MRYVFFGTSHAAPMILKRLIEAGLPPLALVTNPDRPAGRKKTLTPPETKQIVLDSGLPIKILQPENLKDATSDLESLEADFFLVTAYGKIIPKETLGIPRLGTVGIHPSLLPKYRGPSPVQSAILNGEKETGVSLYMLGGGVDDGPVFAEEKIDIGGRPHEEARRALAELAAGMLIKILPDFAEQKVTPLPQDHAQATLTRKFDAEDGFISEADLRAALQGDQEKSVLAIRKIHALNPEPGTWTRIGNKRIKLLEAEMGQDKLILKRIQREGKLPEPFRPELFRQT